MNVKKSLKIFLSSTVKDLAAEREIAARAIKELRLEAIRAETFGATAQTPLETCREMVRDSDVFIGIYGGRYGHVPPGQSLSVTEMEFQEARRVGKDILVYIKGDVELESEQAAFLRRADDFQGGYFRRPPFRTLSDLEEGIKEDLIALLSSRFVTTALPKTDTLSDEYRSYVSALYENVSFAGLAQTPSGLSLPLAHVFIAPDFRELQFRGEVVSETLHLEEVLFNNRRTVIVGAPGTGKTVLLKFLAQATAGGRLLSKEGFILPILVPLASLTVGPISEPLDRRICRFIANRTQSRFEPLIEEALRSGTALLLLDGLDEIDQPDLVDRLVAELGSFCATYPTTRVIVTTRPMGWRAISEFASYEILPWNDSQISRFARQWSAALNQDLQLSSQADEQARQLVNAIFGHPELLQLARNPLFLTLLAFLQRQAYRLPTRRVEIYDAIVRTMVGSWDRARSLSHTLPSTLDESQVDRLLSALAFEMTARGLRVITESHIESFAGASIIKEELSGYDVRTLLSEISNRTGLLLKASAGGYTFVHLSFQEFFAAKALAAMEDEGALRFITEHFYDSQYEEAIRLALSWIDAHGERQSLVARAAEELLNAAKD